MAHDAKRLVRVHWEPRGGDAPYGWQCDSYTVEIGDIAIETYRDKNIADKMAAMIVRRINKFMEDGIS